MCEKNKKKRFHNWRLGISILSVVVLVFLYASPVMAVDIYFPDASKCPNSSGVYTMTNLTDPMLCACNINIEGEHYICPPGSVYACSTNNYLTPTNFTDPKSKIVYTASQACLLKSGQTCSGSEFCEANTLCKNGQCALDTGGDIFAGGGLGDEVTDIRDTIRTFINIALGFLGVLCVVFIIYGGVLWLTSSGKSDQVKKGQDTMIWAALGAIIITIAWTITSYILHIGETVG